MKRIMSVLLVAATWTAGAQTDDDTVASVCEALADSPEDGSLLEKLKPLVMSDHPDAKSGRLAVRVVARRELSPVRSAAEPGTAPPAGDPRGRVPPALSAPTGVAGCIMQAMQVTRRSDFHHVWKKDVRGKKVIYGLSLAAHVPIFTRNRTGIQLATELGVRNQLIKFDFNDKGTQAWGDHVISSLIAGIGPNDSYKLPGKAMAGSMPREVACFARRGRKW